MTAPDRPPRRRSTEEVRRLMVESARELFAERGYVATKTQDIAEHAGVTHRMLFKNFGSKAGLFNTAIVEPLCELINDYGRAWDESPANSTAEERITRLITGMYNFAQQNRVALRTALGGPHASTGEDLLDQIASSLHATLELDAAHKFEALDSHASLIDIAGMAFGVALLDEMLVPRGARRPSRERLQAEMIKTALHGIIPRLQDPPTEDGSRQPAT